MAGAKCRVFWNYCSKVIGRRTINKARLECCSNRFSHRLGYRRYTAVFVPFGHSVRHSAVPALQQIAERTGCSLEEACSAHHDADHCGSTRQKTPATRAEKQPEIIRSATRPLGRAAPPCFAGQIPKNSPIATGNHHAQHCRPKRVLRSEDSDIRNGRSVRTSQPNVMPKQTTQACQHHPLRSETGARYRICGRPRLCESRFRVCARSQKPA